MIHRLREFCRQAQAEEVNNNRNNIHQTWGPPLSRALYIVSDTVRPPSRSPARRMDREFMHFTPTLYSRTATAKLAQQDCSIKAIAGGLLICKFDAENEQFPNGTKLNKVEEKIKLMDFRVDIHLCTIKKTKLRAVFLKDTTLTSQNMRQY